MKTLRVFFLCLVTLGASVSSAFGLEGRLIDKRTGAPIAGAEVLIVGLTGSVRTDADGRFTWQPNPAAPFEVLVILPNGTVSKPTLITSVDWAAVLTITVEPAVNEEVTVTAGVAPSIDAAPGAGMTLLSGRDVALRQPANLMQALEDVPGVSQVSEGQAAVPAVRSMARGRTLILIDGARVTSERRAGPSATFMDPLSVESIDVARGPGSVAYGSDALGGVISVRTRRPVIGSPWQARATGTLGAGIPDQRGGIELSRGYASRAFLLQAHVRSVEDYGGPDAPVLNSGYEDRGVLARVEQRVGTGLLSLGWRSDLSRNIERPRNNSATVRFYYPFENSHRFTAAYERGALGTFDHVKVHGFFGTSKQRTDQDRPATSSRARSIERSDISASDLSLRAIGEKLLGRAKLEVGADINGRFGLEAHDIAIAFDQAGQQTSSTDNLSTESARRIDLGLFLQTSAALAPRVHVAGGLRADVVSSKNTGGYFGTVSVSHQAAAGFAALTVGPFEGFSVTGQVSRGFRDPTLSDRFYRGPTARGFITGNPDLDPESSLQFDLGTRYASGRIRLAAYLYHYRITNLVERYSTSTDFFFFRNRGRAQYRGAELEVQIDLGRGLSAKLSGQVARGRALEDGEDALWLDDVAPRSLAMVIRKQVLTKASVHLRVAAFGADNRPGPSEIPTPGYTVIDVGSGWWVTPHVELRASGRNLLNQAYYASPDSRWVFAPGRSGSVTAVVQF
ncbi:MAG: TonB-dependent receptor [Acidobacteria bacterium]|nr:TonB-dependent receptor [Acidobacteriota bacterium]